MNLLSIDWDFFFPNRSGYGDSRGLYDWGSRESKFFIETLWELRASAFIGADEPLPTTTGEERAFWPKFHVKPDAPLFLGESHAFATDPKIYRLMLEDGTLPVIYSFDAHHDLGYHEHDLANVLLGISEAGSWLLWYALNIANPVITICYPSWHTKFRQLDTFESRAGVVARRIIPHDSDFALMPVFDAIFICRSGAWVPSWLDDDFFAFVDAAPTQNIIPVGSNAYTPVKRPFDLKMASECARTMDEFRANIELRQDS